MSSGPVSLGNHGIRRFEPSQASAVAGPGQKPVLKTAQDRKIWQTSLKFEAVFMQQMLSSMHTSAPKSGLLPSGFAEQVHNSMMDQAVAKEASQTDSLGIAPNIYRMLRHASAPQVQSASGDILKTNLNGKERGEHHGTD